MLLNLLINDLESGLSDKVIKFMDATQLFRRVKFKAGRRISEAFLQNAERATKWQMIFVANKSR